MMVFYNGSQNIFTSNLYWVGCENRDEENMPQQVCIINVCSVADILNSYFHPTPPFFCKNHSFLTQKPPSQWTIHLNVLLTALYLLPSVFLLCVEMTALHLKMPHQLYCCLSHPFEIHWKPGRPQPAPDSLSTERRQGEHYNTGCFGVESGAFLIFCVVQIPHSELGWQLECCYTSHMSVKPSYSLPLYTLCFTVAKNEAFIHTRFSSEYTLKEGVHMGTQAGTKKKEASRGASLKHVLVEFTQTHVCMGMHAEFTKVNTIIPYWCIIKE